MGDTEELTGSAESTEQDVDQNTSESIEDEKVELEATKYDQLLESIAALEEENASLRKTKEEQPDIDSLLDEGKPNASKDTQDTVNVEEMSNTELVNFILNNVDQVGKGIINKVLTMEVKSEIKECEAKFDDFADYKKATQEIALKNPQLSVEQAYKLAKAENPPVDKKGEDGKDKRTFTERRLNLPVKKAFGEKPGVTAKATKANTLMTSKDAASAAWDEVMNKK